MKVALINPFEESSTPPMGLVYLATYLKHYGGYDCKIIDANVHNVLEEIRGYKPDVVGISAMTISYNEAIRLAGKIREDLDVLIVLGGVHISTLPTSLHRAFDIAVIGEGEQTFLELIQLYERDGHFKNFMQVKGIALRDTSLKITDRRELIEPLDRVLIPDRSYLDKGYFESKEIFFTRESGREAHILSSRGCPFKCRFCSTSSFWGKVRVHSVEHVTEEVLELIERYKVDSIHINDDMFTFNKKRLGEIAISFKEHGIVDKVRFSCQPRANLIDKELCEILRDIGVVAVGFGFESGSDKVLSYLKAGSVSVVQNIRAAKLCKDNGFRVFGSLMFGSPYETIEDMQRTLKFIDLLAKLKVDLLWAFVATPFPATEFWTEAKKRGRVDDEDMNWDLLSLTSDPMLISVDKEDFKEIFEEAKQRIFVNFERRYWKRPLSWYISEGLRNPKRGFQVLVKILGGLKYE